MRKIDVAIGMVCREGKVLICQRRSGDAFGGYWEFPGGKQEPDESPEQCLARELAEEVAIRVCIFATLDVIQYDYDEVRVRLHPFACNLLEGDPQPLACQQLAWVTPSEFPRYRFPAANDALLRWLADRLGGQAAKA